MLWLAMRIMASRFRLTLSSGTALVVLGFFVLVQSEGVSQELGGLSFSAASGVFAVDCADWSRYWGACPFKPLWLFWRSILMTDRAELQCFLYC